MGTLSDSYFSLVKLNEAKDKQIKSYEQTIERLQGIIDMQSGLIDDILSELGKKKGGL